MRVINEERQIKFSSYLAGAKPLIYFDKSNQGDVYVAGCSDPRFCATERNALLGNVAKIII